MCVARVVPVVVSLDRCDPSRQVVSEMGLTVCVPSQYPVEGTHVTHYSSLYQGVKVAYV